MIRWIFFDVGNVLFNDAPQDFAAFQFFHHAIHKVDATCSFEQLLRQREDLARDGQKGILASIASQWLDKDRIREVYLEARAYLFDRYDQHNLVNEGLADILMALSADGCRLGIIANQPPECRASLTRRGLIDYFEVIAISEELGLHKPSPKIFQWAMDRATSSPEECVMVGDRMDNDIVPAAALGMKTVWLQWPSHREKNWFPTDIRARQFLESCDRVSYFGDGPALVRPDRSVGRLTEIPFALLGLE